MSVTENYNLPTENQGHVALQESFRKAVEAVDAILADLQSQINAASAPTLLQLSDFTTAERDALPPATGLVIYNSDTDKAQVFAGGVWVDLH